MTLSLAFVLLSVALPLIAAAPSSEASSACTGTISSMSDVSSAVQCTTVNINSFTVPAGETFELTLEDDTTVNMSKSNSPLGARPVLTVVIFTVGDVTFGNQTWDGPLFEVKCVDHTNLLILHI